ncbi:MAG TPA: alpha/beta fold hydrolase [Solirubrobacteraceae bacterium]|nr:alpha/beta fold hydrolase [Solirubrobacteraceae bacterium]
MAPCAILVHGGFHGGWCWRGVADRLRAAGWRVFAPSLTGLAERAHLLTPDVGLETHVQDVLATIACEELENVTLCAHSAGGTVCTVVADRVPERIAHLVAIDATIPRPGESLMDVLTDEQGVPEAFRALAAEHGDGYRIPPLVFTPEQFGVTDEADARWVARRMSAHPLRAFEEPAQFDGRGFESIPRRTYLRCERFPIAFGEPTVARLEADPGWHTERWAIGHNAMVIAPDRVAHALLGG